MRRITKNVEKEALRIINEALDEGSLDGGAPAEAVDDENETTGGGPRGTSIDAAFKENALANVEAGTTPAEEAKGDEKGVEVDAMAGTQQVKTFAHSSARSMSSLALLSPFLLAPRHDRIHV